MGSCMQYSYVQNAGKELLPQSLRLVMSERYVLSRSFHQGKQSTLLLPLNYRAALQKWLAPLKYPCSKYLVDCMGFTSVI